MCFDDLQLMMGYHGKINLRLSENVNTTFRIGHSTFLQSRNIKLVLFSQLFTINVQEMLKTKNMLQLQGALTFIINKNR